MHAHSVALRVTVSAFTSPQLESAIAAPPFWVRAYRSISRGGLDVKTCYCCPHGPEAEAGAAERRAPVLPGDRPTGRQSRRQAPMGRRVARGEIGRASCRERV